MFYHLCKNQTRTLYMRGNNYTQKNLAEFLLKKFSVVIAIIVTVMFFYDVIKSQKRFLMASYNVIKKSQ